MTRRGAPTIASARRGVARARVVSAVVAVLSVAGSFVLTAAMPATSTASRDSQLDQHQP